MGNFAAATELATAKVGRASARLSGEIQSLGNVVGGQAGEITNAIGTIGMAGAGLANTGDSIRKLGGAFGDVAASSRILSAALSAIPIVVVAAAVVGGVIKIKDEIDNLGTTLNQFSSDEVTRLRAGMATLTREFGVNAQSGGVLGDSYRKAQARLADLTGVTDKHTFTVETATQAIYGARVASDDADAAVRQLTKAWYSEADAAGAAAGFLYKASGATVANAAAAEAAVGSLIDQARGLDAVAIAAQRAAAALAGYKVGHPMNLRKPGTADSDIRFSSTGGVVDEASGLQANQNFQTSWDLAHPTATHRGGGSGGIAKAADDALAEVKRAISGARSAGDTYYDNVHDQQLKAARDAHDRANKEIAEARRAATEALSAERNRISATLAERRRLNAEPVTAAEQAMAAFEKGLQSRDLAEAMQAAQASGDPKAIRDANEAQMRAQLAANVEQLRAQQAENDRAAEAMAAAQLAAAEEADTKRQADLDARQREEDAAATKREQAADDLWVANRKKFDEHILALDESKKATLRLAQLEELRLLSDELQRAKAGGTPREVIAAQNAYDEARKSAGHHAAGGWAGLGGPELSWLGESGPEYVVRNQDLRSMGGVTIHPGAIVVNGSGNPEDVARSVMLQLKRAVNRQRTNLTADSLF